MVERHRVGFPVVYGLDVRKEAEKIGAYFDSENGYFQPANFILRNRKVVNATYSSGPLGRLQAQHVLMLVGMAEKTEAELELELTGEQMKEFKKIQES